MSLKPTYRPWMSLLLGFSLLLACRTQEEGQASSERHYSAVQSGTLQISDLAEASGLAASRRDDTLWSHNDSGTSPVLYAMGPDGSARGEVRVRGVENRDWEDLSSFVIAGTPYLLIADVGDNAQIYGTYALHVVEEPRLDHPPGDVPVAWTVRFRYPKGAMDCEAVAVDVAEEHVLLLTKRTEPPVLYDLPLRPADTQVVVARQLTEVPHIPQPTEADLAEDPLWGHVRAQPTAMDINDEGTVALVQTYGDTYLFRRAPGETWAEVFARVPETIDTPQLAQTEAACFAGSSICLTTEKHPAPLYRIDLPPSPPLHAP
jgi:hypothetical protein